MPTFDTPESISLTVDIYVGDVRITAADRTDTVVDVVPTDPADESDVQAAAQVRIERADGGLKIVGPKRVFDFSRQTRSVQITVELPAGSTLDVQTQAGDIRVGGRLADCRFKTGIGTVTAEHTGALKLRTGFGAVTAGSVDVDAEISTGSGEVRIGQVTGGVQVKNSNGDTGIDTVAGDVRVRNANGGISIGHAGAGVDVKTSNGPIRLGEVVEGQITLGTAAGHIEIGIADGTAAWLDLHTGFGRVRNDLDTTTRPENTDHTVEISGRTGYGDITLHRS
ncbi:MAG: DUF4097 family beta strand repeat protein [Hamadaea sp.]|nr:DUF4097 family beta strand repeat protein [Hamadaea sp.]